MAGKFRRKFVDIISDKVTEHYHGKVADKDLDEVMQSLRSLISRLDNSKQDGQALRNESLRQLKKLPIEKLKELLSAEG